MSNLDNALTILLNQTPVESLTLPLPYTVKQVIDQMMQEHGIDPTIQYCSVTGRPYGNLPAAELEQTIRFLDEDDLEQFCDDLAVRFIAGMRPCLNWSRVEPMTIEFARHNDKAGLLAYLVHRANESKPSMDLKYSEMMDRNRERIVTYRAIEKLVASADVSELTQLLLQGDTMGNLHRFSPPTVILNKYGRVDRCRPKQSNRTAFDPEFLTPAHLPALIKIVSSWVTGILDTIEKESRVAMADARFASTKGNRITEMAYTRSWMENPVSALSSDSRNRQAAKKAGLYGLKLNLKSAKPKTPTKKAQAQHDIDALFAQVEEAIKSKSSAPIVETPPVAQVKRVVRFTSGMKFGAPKA